MKALNGFSYFFALVILFVIGPKRLVIADECPGSKEENRLRDQDFGMVLTPDDMLTSMFSPSFISPWMFRDYFRPWRHLAAMARDLGSTLKIDKDKFHVNLDVQHFAPEELTVKTADGYVVIEGKHQEKKDDHGSISRQFVRKYSLPDGVEPESLVSQISSDGVLTITAPIKEVERKGERVVPITPTGPVRKEAKEEKDSSSPSKNEL